MVSYRVIGRCGNSHFQAAAAYGYAKRHGLEFSATNVTSSQIHSPLYFNHLVHKGFTAREDVLINESVYEYEVLPYKAEWKDLNIILNGYWQSELYFKEFRQEVLNLFGYKWNLNEGFVSVHIRRTDFLDLKQKHPEVTDEWYLEAMSKFENKKFIFFSDDIEYCKEHFGNRNDVFFSEGNGALEDMILGSQSESQIISASTFGWWMAWLNRNEEKKIIVPENWFVQGWMNMDTKNVIPDKWIKL